VIWRLALATAEVNLTGSFCLRCCNLWQS